MSVESSVTAAHLVDLHRRRLLSVITYDEGKSVGQLTGVKSRFGSLVINANVSEDGSQKVSKIFTSTLDELVIKTDAESLRSAQNLIVAGTYLPYALLPLASEARLPVIEPEGITLGLMRHLIPRAISQLKLEGLKIENHVLTTLTNETLYDWLSGHKYIDRRLLTALASSTTLTEFQNRAKQLVSQGMRVEQAERISLDELSFTILKKSLENLQKSKS